MLAAAGDCDTNVQKGQDEKGFALNCKIGDDFCYFSLKLHAAKMQQVRILTMAVIARLHQELLGQFLLLSPNRLQQPG